MAKCIRHALRADGASVRISVAKVVIHSPRVSSIRKASRRSLLKSVLLKLLGSLVKFEVTEQQNDGQVVAFD